MAFLLDTSVLVRMANHTDALFPVAANALLELHRRAESLYITPQNLIEFRNVATRPLSVNGLGMAAAETETNAAAFEAEFALLADTPDIYPAWKAIVAALGVIGKQVHDARLVAVCHVHAITHLLTFNTTHFVTLARCAPGIVVVDPATV